MEYYNISRDQNKEYGANLKTQRKTFKRFFHLINRIRILMFQNVRSQMFYQC